jgi:hypothetical protein
VSGASTGDETERYDRDAAGHIIELTRETVRYGISSTSVTTLSYDELGRLVLTEVDGGASWEITSADGVPDGRTVTRYFADGRKSVDTIGTLGDLANDTFVVDGVSRPAYHSTELSSAGCAALESAIPKTASLACAADW